LGLGLNAGSGIAARRAANCAAILLLGAGLAACAGAGAGLGMGGSDDSRSISYTDDKGIANQPYPNNYRVELLAFLKTYLNNPVGVRDAVVAEPVQRTVGGRLRYFTCLRFSPRDSDGSYHDARERAVVYVDGRLDHVVEKAGELCAGAAYAAFPELEKLAR
jgi:hypothetical protein